MGELARLLKQAASPEPTQTTTTDGAGNYTQSRVLERQPTNAEELLETFGHDPEAFEVVGAIRISHRELADGRVVSTYGYRLQERSTRDLDRIIEHVQNTKPPSSRLSGAGAFVFQAGDLQLGKRSRDGATEQIVTRYLDAVNSAYERWQDSGCGTVQLCYPGDCIEGGTSQGGRNAWLTQETVPEQTRIFRRLLLETVDRFRGAEHLYVDVVNGNHDQNQRQWNSYPGDGWATETAIALDDILKHGNNRDAYSHVEVRVPEKWSGSMTVPVGDSVVTVVHGHQWPRGRGMKWWDEQAANHQPARGAQVLQHGHIHTWEVEGDKHRIRVSSPTFDCGSDWFRERHGGESIQGGLVYVLSGGCVSEMGVV